MKHSYLALLLLGLLAIGSQHLFAKNVSTSSNQHLEPAYSETSFSAEQIEMVQPVALVATQSQAEPDSTQQSSPVGSMFQQVVDWLYPRQDTTKNRPGKQ